MVEGHKCLLATCWHLKRMEDSMLKVCITKMKLPSLYEQMEQITKGCTNDD